MVVEPESSAIRAFQAGNLIVAERAAVQQHIGAGRTKVLGRLARAGDRHDRCRAAMTKTRALTNTRCTRGTNCV